MEVALESLFTESLIESKVKPFIVFGKAIQKAQPSDELMGKIFKQLLSKIEFNDLFLIKNRPIDACDILNDCDILPEEITREQEFEAILKYLIG